MNFARMFGIGLATGMSLLVGAGCMSGSDAQVSVQIAQIVNSYPSYPRINRAAYPSTLGAFDVDVYVSADGAEAYRAIEPDKSGSQAAMPVGTVIVRTVVDANRTVTKLTLMVKGSEDTNERCGGWWFGVADPSGHILADSSGIAQAGAVPACESCHIPRAGDDYVFGVSTAYRM